VEDETLFDQVRDKIVLELQDAVSSGVTGSHQLSQVVRRVVGKWVGGQHRRRPMILPLVIEV
jgi:ribonuclease J